MLRPPETQWAMICSPSTSSRTLKARRCCETPWPSGHGGNELGHPEGGCRGWQEKKCIGRTEMGLYLGQKIPRIYAI